MNHPEDRGKKNIAQQLLRRLRELVTGKPDHPDDPCSYVTAPKKPRLPHLSAAAVAEQPKD